MATVIGITTLSLEKEQLRQYVDLIGEAVTSGLGLPSTMKSVTLLQVPQEASTPKPYGLITFFAFSAPNKPVEAKRRTHCSHYQGTHGRECRCRWRFAGRRTVRSSQWN